jgi:uncharacterized cupin superfamily protein
MVAIAPCRQTGRTINPLEATMSIANAIKFAHSSIALSPAPINPDWILDGAPVARDRQLYRSNDESADTFIWDCTAGRFNWYYNVDETVFLIEGAVVVRDETGALNHLQAGSTMFFPAGSKAEWTVHRYVRKIAFCRVPLTRKLIAARYVYRGFKRLIGQGYAGNEAAAMFHGGTHAQSNGTHAQSK